MAGARAALMLGTCQRARHRDSEDRDLRTTSRDKESSDEHDHDRRPLCPVLLTSLATVAFGLNMN